MDDTSERHISRTAPETDQKGRQETVLGALVMWLVWHREKARARHEAARHLAAVARALYTGDTSAYTLTPDLPRVDDSTQVRWHD